MLFRGEFRLGEKLSELPLAARLGVFPHAAPFGARSFQPEFSGAPENAQTRLRGGVRLGLHFFEFSAYV